MAFQERGEVAQTVGSGGRAGGGGEDLKQGPDPAEGKGRRASWRRRPFPREAKLQPMEPYTSLWVTGSLWGLRFLVLRKSCGCQLPVFWGVPWLPSS